MRDQIARLPLPLKAGALVALTCLMTLGQPSAAQATPILPFIPHVPLTNTVGVAVNQSITASFTTTVAAASVTSRTFAVHTGFGGLLTGTLSVSGNTVTLHPNRDYFSGERVQVIATTAISSAGGAPLGPLQWGFTAGPLSDRCSGGFREDDAGLTGVYASSGAWGDYDGDGDLDLLLSGYDGSNPTTTLYRNDAGAFVDAGAGLIDLYDSTAAWGDYDNDGDLDLLLAGFDDANRVTTLYRNDGGVFADSGAGLAEILQGSAAWGDYDNDGDLDIALAGYSNSGPVTKLYRNDGGAFTEIATAFAALYHSNLVWGDYDNDGDLDLLLTGHALNDTPVTSLQRNDGGTFVDTGAQLTAVGYSSAAWGDYDGDRDLDLLLTGWDSANNEVTTLYRNEDGAFVDAGAGIVAVLQGGVAWGDYDNDGDLDILLAGSPATDSPSAKVYRNDDGSFVEIGAAFTGVKQGFVAWGDYDNDGDLDILLAGLHSNAELEAKLYRNVNCADPTLVKAVTPADVAPGTIVTFTLSFANPGPDSAFDVTISDSIPVSISVIGVTNSGVLITQTSSAPDLGWAIPQLAAGEHGVITITGLLVDDSALFNTTFTNTATISAANDITPDNNSAGTVVRVRARLQVAFDGTGAGAVSSTPLAIDCTVDCATSLDQGAVITLTAGPAAGSVFSGWDGDCAGPNPCALSMTASRNVTATFDLLPASVGVSAARANTEFVLPGDSIPWEITITNTGQVTATVSEVSGVLAEDGLYLTSAGGIAECAPPIVLALAAVHRCALAFLAPDTATAHLEITVAGEGTGGSSFTATFGASPVLRRQIFLPRAER
jgi:uncharacterized repeat protein (TIGR01451 family)